MAIGWVGVRDRVPGEFGGSGSRIRPAIANGQDTQDVLLVRHLLRYLACWWQPRCFKFPNMLTNREVGWERAQDPWVLDPECQHSWACDIEYWVFMRFRFGVLSLAPLRPWKIEHLAPTLWILKQFYACHFAFWIGCVRPIPSRWRFGSVRFGFVLVSWVTFRRLWFNGVLQGSSESFSAVYMVNT